METGASASNTQTAGLIVREHEPPNLEFPFDRLDERLIPAPLFYVRNHFPTPQLDARAYRLDISGAVRTPLTLRLEELQSMHAQTRAVTLECAGNGRVFLHPPADGVQWEMGAVGTAEWTGAPLSLLLDRAGISGEACEILLEGADCGVPSHEPRPPSPIHYARSIPVSKAGDTLLAWAMNGEPLSPDHGFPLRAIVPGHYGMASVKWLTAVRVLREPFHGYWQTSDYAYWDTSEHHPVRRALGPMALKSQIARPCMGEVIRAGSTYRVFGAAWSGESDPARVDVSTDDGRSWSAATFLDPSEPHVWRRWTFEWDVPRESGPRVLQSRVYDANGAAQPAEHDQRFGSYCIHHVSAVEVVVT